MSLSEHGVQQCNAKINTLVVSTKHGPRERGKKDGRGKKGAKDLLGTL